MRRPRFARVAFDVDSTLCAIEGIDELARMRDADVSDLTERAMRGELRLEEVFGRRLGIVRPDARLLARVGQLYVEGLLPGARATVAALARAGVEVWIVSGGLRPALLPLARALAIPGWRLFAVDVRLDGRGRYEGFDERSPLVRSDGKRTIFAALRDRSRRTAHVGDGITDLAAAPSVDAFVAFTGVVERPEVARAARHVASSFPELRDILGVPR